MSYVGQLALFFVVAFIGEAVSWVLPFAMPGSVIAMIILFIMLCLKIVIDKDVAPVADFFVNHMAILFIPLAVGLIDIYPMISGKALGILVLCVVTTILTLFATVGAALLVMRLQGRQGADHVE